MNQYIKTKKGVIDTNVKNNPHTECFHVKDNMLYIEDIYGNIYPYSEIVDNNEVEECN